MRIFWLLAPALAMLWWVHGVSQPPGVLVPEEPRQSAVAGVAEWEQSGFRIQPLATYAIRARLLSKESYWVDFGAKLAPIDLAVGWGPISDSAVLDRLGWSQGHRFLMWAIPLDEMPLPFDQVNSHTANIHVIPATPEILNAIRWTRTGAIIHLSGYLVEAAHPQGMKPWRSSLTRTDTGSGACELMWVDQFTRE